MKKFDAGQQVICRFEDKPRLGLFIGEYVRCHARDVAEFTKMVHQVKVLMDVENMKAGTTLNFCDNEVTSTNKVDFS